MTILKCLEFTDGANVQVPASFFTLQNIWARSTIMIPFKSEQLGLILLGSAYVNEDLLSTEVLEELLPNF